MGDEHKQRTGTIEVELPVDRPHSLSIAQTGHGEIVLGCARVTDVFGLVGPLRVGMEADATPGCPRALLPRRYKRGATSPTQHELEEVL